MEGYDVSNRKREVIEAAWKYLLKTGIGNASVRELLRDAGLGQSTLYNYFKNKDDIWVSAGKYGISMVVDALLTYTLQHTDNIEGYFKTLLDEVEKYKYELRLSLQITTSPVFGDRMRDKAMDFRLWYDRYAEKLMKIFGCSHLQAEVFIYSIISYVIDYVIWDDRDKTQMLLDNLYDRVLRRIDKNKTSAG